VTDAVTVFGSAGYHKSEIDYIYPSPRITSAAGAWSAAPFSGRDVYDNYVGEIGARANLNTGPVNHLFTVNYSAFERDYESIGRGGAAIISNIYTPSLAPMPSFPTLVQSLKTQTKLSSFGVADTMSMFNNRLHVIAGVGLEPWLWPHRQAARIRLALRELHRRPEGAGSRGWRGDLLQRRRDHPAGADQAKGSRHQGRLRPHHGDRERVRTDEPKHGVRLHVRDHAADEEARGPAA
jgi:hypothetical protein